MVMSQMWLDRNCKTQQFKFIQPKIKYCSCPFLPKRSGGNVFQLHLIINLTHDGQYLCKSQNRIHFFKFQH